MSDSDANETGQAISEPVPAPAPAPAVGGAANDADADDADADADDKLDAKQPADASAEPEAEEEPWPPVDWVDRFEVPRNFLCRLINVVPHVISFMAPDNEDVERMLKEAKKDVPVIFFSHDAKKTKFAKGEWNPLEWRLHPAPNMPGVVKGIYMHHTTLALLKKLGKFRSFADFGLDYHTAPHPTTHDVHVVREIYVMPGATIQHKLVGDKRCANCERGATRVCHCQAAVFCSVACEDMARMNGVHAELDCRVATRRLVEQDATRARERIIEKHADIERERERAAKLSKAQETMRGAKQGNSASVARYRDMKRARLQLESARARQALGMGPSQNLPPIDELEAAVEGEDKD